MHPRLSSLRAFLALLTTVFLVTACGGGGDEQVDSIEIVTVTPTTTGADQSTNFTVLFRYTLASRESGVVNMGFFIDSTNQTLVPENLVVTRGTGTGTLSARAVPSQYTRTVDFAVGVLLSESPHGAAWTPLARDKQFVSLTQ